MSKLNKSPNIVFILADDLGWMDLSCMGSGFYETPNIDRLAREGMRFSNAYAACPVCSPTRASIMTGKYPASVGITNFIGGSAKGYLLNTPYSDHIDHKERALPMELRDAGYSTWHVGKWHLAGAYSRSDDFKRSHYPDKHGFDVNIAGCESGMPHHGYFAPWMINNLSEGKEGDYLPDRLTDDAINLIKSREEKPFFLNLWYYLVHVPIEAKIEYIEYFKKKKADLSLDQVNEFETGDYFPCEHKKNERIIRRLLQSDAVYAAMLKSLDENVGRLIKTLKDEGIYEETVILFTSDNGGLSTTEGAPTCNKPLSEGKGWMYEGGIREPLIIKWDGRILPGSICNVPVTSPDFYPTLCEIAGKSDYKACEGQSLIRLIEENEDLSLRERPIFWHFPHYANQGGTPGSSVRKDRFKLIQFYEGNKYELYDLQADPGEKNNIFKDHPDVSSDMKLLLEEWKLSVEAKVPLKNPDFIPWSKNHTELI